MAESDFEPFKLEIERLYIHENKTLPHVMDYMASKYSLIKSPGQYNRQLKKWGFVKGRITSDEWNWMANKQNKRKFNDKKESEFYIGGNQVHVPKLKKAKYRDAYVSSIARYSTAPSPKTPAGFFVCTPTSPEMDLTWNGPLPWLRFIKLVRLKEKREPPSSSSSLPTCSPRGADALTRTVNHEVMSRLSTIIPWNRLGHPLNIHSSSQTSAALSILMPEEFQGQHDALSTGLNGPTNKGRDRMSLELFLLSNNITSQDPDKTTRGNMRSDDERMMQMLSDYGWKDLAHVQTLLSTSDPTAEAIAERVFAIALRLHHVDAVKMMLEARMDLNIPLIESRPHGVLTPLQFTAKSHHERSEELVNLLISYGADVNHAGTEYPPLFYAIRKRENRIIRALMLHGAIVTPSCLSIATHLKDIEVFAGIANSCSNVNAVTGWQSALAEAVKRRNVPIIEILLAKGANMDNMVSINFDHHIATTTILGLGAMSRSIDVMRALLRGCHEMNPNFVRMPYVSPIVLAVREESVEITQALLQAGVDIKLADKQGKMTLLERVVKDCSTASLVPLCKVLIAYGAQVDRPFSTQKYETSALLIALDRKSPSPEVVQLLINAGARLNDEYTKRPYTALGAAVEQGNEVLINSLFATGATFVGTKLEEIGSLRTAIYLQENGVLEGILSVSGPGILAAALSSKKTDLAQYLLEHNADHEERIENEAYPPYQRTPLEAATQAQDFTFVKRLLKRGARVTDSVLGDAISKDPVFLKYLLARFHGSAPTAVGAAVSCRASLQLLQLLQGAGLDPTGVPKLFQEYWDLDDFELPLPESVLEIAVVLGTRETLQFLLQWTAWSPRLTGRALTIAIFLDLEDLAEDILSFHPDLTQEITIKYPKCEDEEERETYRPLEAAVNMQMIPVARELMKKVDVNYLGRGARRRTALQYAVEKGNMELINLLISTHKARIDGPPATDGGATALQIASLKGYIGITRRLLDLGADVNEAPAKFNGRTALQGAAEHGRIDTLQMLLNEGALIVGEGEPQYRRAVELAERNGHQAAARLLRSWRDSICLSSSAV
ncbi:Ankyrin repeat-containing domain [Penicillium camemberti]|uniref:Ankyrin repeat-containing domain n=1 Tax=Penicillium camemberti (strain FM 013) TaxID=1429867 RepID=A0A0G4NWU1_PENC3|nr:Ankyrin repeat-containing domain [Penicillium camemberti]